VLLPVSFQTKTHKQLLVLDLDPAEKGKTPAFIVPRHQRNITEMKLSILTLLALAVFQISGHPHSHALEPREPREPRCVGNGGMLHQGSVLVCISSASS
jgi:hypothetical protein